MATVATVATLSLLSALLLIAQRITKASGVKRIRNEARCLGTCRGRSNDGKHTQPQPFLSETEAAEGITSHRSDASRQTVGAMMGGTLTLQRQSLEPRSSEGIELVVPTKEQSDANKKSFHQAVSASPDAPACLNAYALAPRSTTATVAESRRMTPIGIPAGGGIPVDSMTPMARAFSTRLPGSTMEDGPWPGGADSNSFDGSAAFEFDSMMTPAERPLNPDLPSQNTLFIFANFASYMRAPNEGAEDVRESALKHAQRLLEHARELRDNPKNRVNVLHIKYRFPVITMEKQSKEMAPPFATLTDPVIKLDYKQDGGFRPIPTAAILRHIAREIEPPPRSIVYSYVASKKTSSQLTALAGFCDSRRVPIALISPAKTRIREHQPLERALGSAIDMPLYASLPSAAFAAHATGTLGRTICGNIPGWTFAPPASHGGSGGSYIRAKEQALQRHGVISSSYLSVQAGASSSPSATVRAGGDLPGERRVKVARLKHYEALIDALGLGDNGEGDVDECSSRYPYGYRCSSLGRSHAADAAEDTAARKPSQASNVTFCDTTRSSGSSNSRGLRTATSLEMSKGTMFWRNMVLAHADSSNPEYTEGRVG